MVINISELREKNQPLIISRDFSDSELRVGSQISAFPKPVHAELQILLSGDEVLLEGNLDTEVVFTCCRCLRPFDNAIRKEFQLSYQPDRVHSAEIEEIGLSYGDLDTSFYHNDQLDLSAVISEQIVLEIPMKPVCREDCKGLCDQCGSDLNEAQCSCERKGMDPRWAALQDLKKRLEN